MHKVKIIIIVTTIIVLAGTFYIFNAPKDNHPSTVTSGQQTGKQRSFDINISNAKIADGDSTLKARQGDTVTIKINSDTADELHLHGYDKMIQLQPGKTTELTFTADIAGRFEAELHSDKSPIFALEVQPE